MIQKGRHVSQHEGSFQIYRRLFKIAYKFNDVINILMMAYTGHDDSKLQKYITNAEDKF